VRAMLSLANSGGGERLVYREVRTVARIQVRNSPRRCITVICDSPNGPVDNIFLTTHSVNIVCGVRIALFDRPESWPVPARAPEVSRHGAR
jgi:hypothetical protein